MRRRDRVISNAHATRYLWAIALSIVAGLAGGCDTAEEASSTVGVAPSIRGVAVTAEAFSPSDGESVRMGFGLSVAGRATVRFHHPLQGVVRSINVSADSPGDQAVEWDGRDDSGNLVAPEAYAYTIELAPRSGDASVTYDLRVQTGGEYRDPTHSALDRETSVITFGLLRKGRVHLLVSNGVSPRATVWDWRAASAGSNTIQLPFELSPNEGAFMRVMTLPDNVVLVEGSGKQASLSASADLEAEPGPWRLSPPPTSRRLYHHALHPRARCYDPAVEFIALGGEHGPEEVLRLQLSDEQPPGRARPESEVSVYLYADGKAIASYHRVALPLQIPIASLKLDPGEHRLTAVAAWRNEHSGIAHRNILVQRPST